MEWVFILLFIFVIIFVFQYRNLRLANEKKEQKRKLLKSLQVANKLAKMGIWELNLISQELYFSQELCELYNIKQNGFTMHFEEYLKYVHPDDTQYYLDTVAKALESHNINKMQYRIVLDDGSVKNLLIHFEYGFDKDGNLIEINGYGQDVTQQVLLEQENIQKTKELNDYKNLLEKKVAEQTQEIELFRDLVEYTTTGITLADVNQKDMPIVYANDMFEKITGYKKEDVIGKNCRFLQGDNRDQESRHLIREAIKNKQSIQIEVQNYKQNGELFLNLLTLTPLYNREGELTHYIGIQNDITEHKAKDRALFETSKMASIGEMIANIAHQWRQPLNVILNYASFAQMKLHKESPKYEKLESNMEQIQNNAQYLSKTIDTFREFLHNSNEKESIVVDTLVEKSLFLLEGVIKQNNIEIINKITSNPNSEMKVFLSVSEFEQVMINIINNAKDILLEKKIENPWITIDKIEEDDFVKITIEDNGGGMDEDILYKIFDPYFTTKHKSQGTGLGLHMSYRIVSESFGGKLYAQNTQNGAKFYIALPL